MATKTEERLKLLLEEYLDSKQQKQEREIADHIYGIFLWGMIFGVLISYMSIFPIGLGIVIGYGLSQKRWLVLEKWRIWMEDMIGRMNWINIHKDIYSKI